MRATGDGWHVFSESVFHRVCTVPTCFSGSLRSRQRKRSMLVALHVALHVALGGHAEGPHHAAPGASPCRAPLTSADADANSARRLRVVVSVASVPPRFALVPSVVAALHARQTRSPNTTLLVISKRYNNFEPADTAPVYAAAARDPKRVRVYTRATDLGPVTKLVGALEFLQSAALSKAALARTVLLTIDDDMEYPIWLIEHMLHWAVRFPRAVIANTGSDYREREHSLRKLPLTVGRASRPWPGIKATPNLCTALQANLLNGWAGVLYRPSFFADDEPSGGHEGAAAAAKSLLATTRFTQNLSYLRGNLSFLDDHYISASLTLREVPILVVPPLVGASFYPRSHWYRNKFVDRRSHTINETLQEILTRDMWVSSKAHEETSAAKPALAKAMGISRKAPSFQEAINQEIAARHALTTQFLHFYEPVTWQPRMREHVITRRECRAVSVAGSSRAQTAAACELCDASRGTASSAFSECAG